MRARAAYCRRILDMLGNHSQYGRPHDALHVGYRSSKTERMDRRGARLFSVRQTCAGAVARHDLRYVPAMLREGGAHAPTRHPARSPSSEDVSHMAKTPGA